MSISDTDPTAARFQVELLRQASVTRRATLARSLSTTTLQLARRAVAAAHPGASEAELGVHWIAACYGRDLAERFRRYLEARDAGRPT